MTTDLEKQFFSTFGIEPDVESCYRRCYHKRDTKSYLNCKDCDRATVIYPQITDRILLELICVHNTYLEANLYSLDYESLGKEILEDLIEEQESRELKKDYVSDDMKQQVQALFKEE